MHGHDGTDRGGGRVARIHRDAVRETRARRASVWFECGPSERCGEGEARARSGREIPSAHSVHERRGLTMRAYVRCWHRAMRVRGVVTPAGVACRWRVSCLSLHSSCERVEQPPHRPSSRSVSVRVLRCEEARRAARENIDHQVTRVVQRSLYRFVALPPSLLSVPCASIVSLPCACPSFPSLLLLRSAGGRCVMETLKASDGTGPRGRETIETRNSARPAGRNDRTGRRQLTHRPMFGVRSITRQR